MENFWDFSVWGSLNLIAFLFLGLLFANLLKKSFKFLKASLIPTSVLGGLILLIISAVYGSITGDTFFNSNFFAGKGVNSLEIVTYHALALGFIAMTFSSTGKKMDKKRSTEIFNTGVTTVSTYLLQAVFGLGITLLFTLIVPTFFPAAGVLLPFGYGQGSGQALNYGSIFEEMYGFVGGKSFGLTIAALGFISASIGGVIHLQILKKRGKLVLNNIADGGMKNLFVQDKNEISMNGTIDKMTVQISIIFITYGLAFLLMYFIGELFPSMRSVVFGFNFLFGVLFAVIIKWVLKQLKNKNIVKKQYTNSFLLTRISNTCFDIMIVAGIAAIRVDLIKDYWHILLILGLVGLLITYAYNIFVAKVLFKDYYQEQFLAMYGMLTGTASTGVMLLREIDGEFKTPVAENLVYQNLPAIVFGFPLMFLATLAPQEPLLTLLILFLFFVVMNIILFRSFIFRKKREKINNG